MEQWISFADFSRKINPTGGPERQPEDGHRPSWGVIGHGRDRHPSSVRQAADGPRARPRPSRQEDINKIDMVLKGPAPVPDFGNQGPRAR